MFEGRRIGAKEETGLKVQNREVMAESRRSQGRDRGGGRAAFKEPQPFIF